MLDAASVSILASILARTLYISVNLGSASTLLAIAPALAGAQMLLVKLFNWPANLPEGALGTQYSALSGRRSALSTLAYLLKAAQALSTQRSALGTQHSALWPIC